MDSNEFAKEVCKYIKNATPNEREAVAEELNAHLDDHAEALISAGRSREDAYDDAVAAMGDPVEIGNELNKEFPKVWLVLSRVAAVLLVLAILVLVQPLIYSVGNSAANILCRIAPQTMTPDYSGGVEQTNIDVRMDAVSGDVIRFCSECIVPNYDSVRPGDYLICRKCGPDYYDYKGYVALLTVVMYDKVPTRPIMYLGEDCISFAETDDEWTGTVQGSLSSRVYAFYMVMAPVEYGQKTLTVVYDKYGTHAETVIPLNWEGVE